MNFNAIVDSEKSAKEKMVLFFLYFKITFKYLVGKIFPALFRKESFLGFQMEFFTYQDFSSLFNEIFILEEYDFKNVFVGDVFEKKENFLIIDGGSNVGMSVLYFKKKYPKAQITAFEPDEKTFQMLEKNIQINELSNVELHQMALSDEAGRADFYFEKNKSGSLGMSLFNRFEVKNREYKKETVKIARLSDYIKMPVDLLKLDIEGAENKVVMDLEKNNKLILIERIIIEYHHGEESRGNNLEEILAILKKNNFKTKTISVGDQLLIKNNLQHNSLIYARRND